MQCNITRSLYSRRHCLDAANSGMGELALHAKTPSQKCTAQTSPILSPYLPLTMTVAHTVPVFFDITISARKVREQRKSSENGTVSNTAESPVGGRPLCEARPNVVRQLYFSKIAVRSAIRSTLLTAGRLAATRLGQASKNQACLGFATSAAKARQRQCEGRTSYIAWRQFTSRRSEWLVRPCAEFFATFCRTESR